jgi:hypothetical protein
MSLTAADIVISPVNMFWRIEAQFTVDFEDVTAAGFGGTSFTFYDGNGNQFYAWGDENSTDSDPSESGTAIEVDYGAGAAASAIATAAQAAIDGTAGFSATVSGTVVTVTNDDVGRVTAGVVNTDVPNLVVNQCLFGQNFELGLLEGEPTPSLEFDNLTITSQQNGTTPLSEIHRGVTPTVETVIQETTKSKLDTLMSIYGGKFTPGGGTEVFGIGTIAIGKNMLTEAARLEFVPVNTLGGDLDYNINYMFAVPQLNSILISGENPRTFTVAWNAFPDLRKDTRVNTVLVGDPDQTGI